MAHLEASKQRATASTFLEWVFHQPSTGKTAAMNEDLEVIKGRLAAMQACV
jgi:hypothetical protein